MYTMIVVLVAALRTHDVEPVVTPVDLWSRQFFGQKQKPRKANAGFAFRVPKAFHGLYQMVLLIFFLI